MDLATNDKQRPFQFRLRTLLIVLTVSSVPLGWIGWMIRAPQRAWQRGWQRAEEDWAAQKAVFYALDDAAYDYMKKSFRFRYEYDPETGLPVRYQTTWQTRPEFYEGYQARILELVKLNGPPSWGLKQQHVTEEELVTALQSKDFREITIFPHDVTPNIVVFKRGIIHRWGGTMSSNDDTPSVGTPHLLLGLARQAGKPVFVGRLPNRPGVYFMRCDSAMVSAFLDDGRYLCSVRAK